MALNGLQIFKYLPGGKKEKEANCKKCGFPTCMAFAMKLAKNEADFTKCEYISEELKALLNEASVKQQEEITFGGSKNTVKIGNETVMFRHEKTFVNPACISVTIKSSDRDFDKKLAQIAEYSIERVGETFKIDAVTLVDDGNYQEQATKVVNTGLPLIIKSSDVSAIRAVLDNTKNEKPLIYAQNCSIQELADIEKEFGVPVVISAETIAELADKADEALKAGIKSIVLNINDDVITGKTLENNTFIRRSAIEDKFTPLGFPVLSCIKDSGDVFYDSVLASSLLCKYSGIIILENFNNALISALFTLRQNIYTDPQKPLQVEPKIYPVGEPDKNSPVIVTTNFALTYFAVVSEIEASGKSAYLLITPSDGMSVLTAWSASKFTGEIIAKAVNNYGLADMVDHREFIISGLVASMKEEIEEELPDWKVVIGPNEAVEIVDFLKKYTAGMV